MRNFNVVGITYLEQFRGYSNGIERLLASYDELIHANRCMDSGDHERFIEDTLNHPFEESGRMLVASTHDVENEEIGIEGDFDFDINTPGFAVSGLMCAKHSIPNSRIDRKPNISQIEPYSLVVASDLSEVEKLRTARGLLSCFEHRSRLLAGVSLLEVRVSHELTLANREGQATVIDGLLEDGWSEDYARANFYVKSLVDGKN